MVISSCDSFCIYFTFLALYDLVMVSSGVCCQQMLMKYLGFYVSNFLQIELNFMTEPRKVKQSRHGVVFCCYYLSLRNSA